MRTKKRTFPIIPAAIAAGICLIIVLLIVIISGTTDKAVSSDKVRAGIDYLESLEAKEPADVQAVRKEIEQAKLAAQYEELIAQLNDGTIDPFSLFKDYVVLGDSRAVGFWYWDLLDKNRVIADGGHTIRELAQEIDSIAALNPSTIYLCYGLNDCSIGYWDSAQEYVTEYMQVIDELQERLPDATIVVSSILPAKDPAFATASSWYNIPEWSDALGQACAENGILFANCDYLSDEYPELWDPDGIHFREAFYPLWANCLVATTLMEVAE